MLEDDSIPVVAVQPLPAQPAAPADDVLDYARPRQRRPMDIPGAVSEIIANDDSFGTALLFAIFLFFLGILIGRDAMIGLQLAGIILLIELIWLCMKVRRRICQRPNDL